jgi:hypothetical protein
MNIFCWVLKYFKNHSSTLVFFIAFMLYMNVRFENNESHNHVERLKRWWDQTSKLHVNKLELLVINNQNHR